MTAVAHTVLNPTGNVFLSGEIWNATVENNERIEAGEEVVITQVDGLKLSVRKKN